MTSTGTGHMKRPLWKNVWVRSAVFLVLLFLLALWEWFNWPTVQPTGG